MTLAEYYRKTLGKSHSQIFAMLRKRERAKLGPRLIDVVLLQEAEGLGAAGQVVQVHPARMRTELHPSRQAVYATRENIERWALKPYRVEKMKLEMGIDEREAWALVDEEVARRRTELDKQLAVVHYPRWFTEKHPKYRNE